MSASLASSAKCYAALVDNEPVAICATMVAYSTKNMRRCSRLVVLPDYQGLAIGGQLLNLVAEKYLDEGFRYVIVTSQRHVINSLKKSANWKCYRYGRISPEKTSRISTGSIGSSANRISASFECRRTA